MNLLSRALIFSLLFGFTMQVQAQTDPHVPEPLLAWQDWVLEGSEYRGCPFVFDSKARESADFVCSWPGVLDLEVQQSGAGFTQAWTVYSDDQWLPLPGNATLWPADVSVNGQRVPVVEKNGTPVVRVARGEHRIRGLFSWQRRPSTLPIPAKTGLVALTLNGQAVQRPERNDRGIWLGERKVSTQTRDAIDATVYRLVRDDIPTYLITQLRLNVSGSVREESTGVVLPAGFTPMSVNSGLPARVEADGSLRIQVRPGAWQVTIVARADNVLESLAMPQPGDNLPSTEIWSYARNDNLRVSVAEGLPPVDPAQADVPDEWLSLPAFRVTAGDTLTFSERSRGKTATDNRLSLTRDLWMDFDGDGFVFYDRISGSMRSGWRLDMRAPYELASAEANDKLLVTRAGAEQLNGVEVRQRALRMTAAGRLTTRGAVSATGWMSRFDDVAITLHLPVGTRLFAARGADQARGSWLQQWQLLDFFLVLITAVASTRLFGKRVGALALLVLLLGMNEYGAPVFIWLNLLVATALVRLAPAGGLLRASQWYRNLSIVALIAIFVPYAALQLRAAVYPQLETPLQTSPQASSRETLGFVQVEDVQDFENFEAPRQSSPELKAGAAMEEVIVTASKKISRYERYAPDTVVAVGPGLPKWSNNDYQIRWSGPVGPDQSLQLMVMPRWLVSLLKIISVLSIGLFASFFVLDALKKKTLWTSRSSPGGTSGGSVATSIVVGLLALSVLQSPTANAQMPSAALLKQLEERLLAPAECAPYCADITRASIDVAEQSLTIDLTINALASVAVPIPGSVKGWQPEQVLVNGRRTDAMFISKGSFWLAIDPGIQRITLSGALPPVDAVEVPFARVPKTVTVQANDAWLVSGVDNSRLSSGSLQLTRQRLDTSDPTVRWESSRFPTFVRVIREIDMNLDWSVRTRVERLAPAQGAISLQIPLLADENVITDGMSVVDGKVTVSLSANANATSWVSRYPATSALALRATDDAAMKETWRFKVGGIWRVTFDGLPESEVDGASGEYRLAQFDPRPGESLSVTVERPPAIAGDTLAFIKATVETTVGQRSRDTALSLFYRSTQGNQHIVTLPADARVTSVLIDGRVSPLRAQGNTLALPIVPGDHQVVINLQSDADVSWSERSPIIDIAAAASNVTVDMEMSSSRWVLAVSGSGVGPAVLYWSQLAALILFALILGRIPFTPLKTVHWLLLGLGFSTFSWSSMSIIVVWLVVMGAKTKFSGTLDDLKYNLLQVALGILSFVALTHIVLGLPQGLLGRPEMSIAGSGSYGGRLSWFTDRVSSVLPDASVYSLPMWCYKALILIWALWLSFALLRWLPWAWQQFADGGLWRQKPKVQV